MVTYINDISEHRTLLMGVAMLSIMLFHQGWIWGWNPFFAFFHFYGNWGVDIFFFVSGFGLYYSLKRDYNVISFYKRRLLRMMPLCLVCGMFRYVVDHILPVGIGGYPTGDHEISSNWMTILSWDKWFIPVIMVYYLLMPLLHICVNKYGSRVLLGVYIVALLGALSIFPNWMIIYTIRFPSFCIGIIVAAGVYQLTMVNESFGFIAVFIAMVLKFTGIVGLYTIDDNYIYIILSLGIVFLCLTIIRLLSVPYKIGFVKNSGIGILLYDGVCFIGRHSLEIYLLHEFIYRYAYRFLISTPVPLFFQMLIGMVSSVMIACVFSCFVNGVLKLARL